MKKIVLIFAGALCFSTASIAQTNQTLKLEKGQKYQVDNKLETTSSTEVQGQTMETKGDISSTYNIIVKDKTDNTYNLTNTITQMVMKMSMMGHDVDFDSNKKEDMDGQMGNPILPLSQNN